MAELHGLLALYELSSVVRGAIDLGQHPQCCQQYEDGSENTQLGEKICAVMKNLGHVLSAFLPYLSAGKAEK
jgi:hypothetical protein